MGFGGNEAYDGVEALPKFLTQYNKLLDDLRAAAPEGLRFVILSPIRHEKKPPPLPDPDRMNAKLARYTDALRELALQREIRFVDLFSDSLFSNASGNAPTTQQKMRTENGIHLNEIGYIDFAFKVVATLKIENKTGGGKRPQPDPADEAFTWKAAYSRVAGVLPLDRLPEMRVRHCTRAGEAGVAFVYCEANVTSPGPIRLRINSVDGLTLWGDQVPAELKSETLFELKQGLHRLTWAVDLNRRKQGLALELSEAPGSTTRVQAVSGK